MKQFRWSTTLLLIGMVAALISLTAFINFSPGVAGVIVLAAVLLFLVVLFFGKRGV